ncbi:CPXCG motif-containing cysteine-rich protein [Dyella mobilis]|uniref:CPXCG motif-containing cysteine-rich protein n=1 Tax=Dyella mobilis TaxID=1849582 RepID=A0ABS2KGF2_9GAMM|nr:CPXCG motif-containing cysteine-rich protein [Dyella mobilis]MBM7130115.1 CPXCG motif-containing cysteine-rich protein [Dyella mobilis]
MLATRHVLCPYCGERIEIVIDASAGDQQYIEDCQVCCCPISVEVRIDEDGHAHVGVAGEDEA